MTKLEQLRAKNGLLKKEILGLRKEIDANSVRINEIVFGFKIGDLVDYRGDEFKIDGWNSGYPLGVHKLKNGKWSRSPKDLIWIPKGGRALKRGRWKEEIACL